MIADISDKEIYWRQLSGFLADQAENHPVYRSNRLLSLSGALESNFSVVRYLMGGDFFAALARVYVDHFPSTDWDINLYGDRYPSFIKAQEKSGRIIDYRWADLAWLAELEYRLLLLYYSEGDSQSNLLPEGFPMGLMASLSELVASFSEFHPWLSIHLSGSEATVDEPWKVTVSRRLDQGGFAMDLLLGPADQTEGVTQ